MRKDPLQLANGNSLAFRLDEQRGVLPGVRQLLRDGCIGQFFARAKVVIDLFDEVRVPHAATSDHHAVSVCFIDTFNRIFQCEDITRNDKGDR